MKINPLISEIVRGQWLMDIHQLDGFAPFVHSLLNGGGMPLQQAPEQKIRALMLDSSGQRIEDEEKPDKIAYIPMIGPVMKYGDWCSYGATDIARRLDMVNNDKSVKGIVMYIDGPGGAVSAINPFLDFASRKQKPVVVLSDNACSLHYWTACAVADHIMGENTISGMFGSVGVVSSFLDAKGYWKKKGYEFHEIYPDESKHKNEVFRLALEGKYDKIKTEHLSPIAQKFQAAVRSSRPNLKEEEGVLTGATFGTEKALELGMIDSIGNLQKALEMVDVLAEVYSI